MKIAVSKASGLHVSYAADGGDVMFSPRGGGPVRRMPLVRFWQLHRPPTPEEAGGGAWKLCTVAIEDGPRYAAWVQPEDRWNGWARPYFEQPAVEELLRELKACGYARADLGAGSAYTENPANDDGLQEWAFQTLRIAGEDRVVCPIGAGCWIWSIIEPDEEPLDDGPQLVS